MEGLEDLQGEELLIKLFRFVQAIPYRISKFEKTGILGESVNTSIKCGDNRHKTLLLYNLMMERNFDVDRCKVIFDWADLPIPQEILSILEKSGTRMAHEVLKLNANEHYSIYLDPTWNPELGSIGFPVTGDWDGKSPTGQVTNGDLRYFDAEGFSDEDHGIILDEDEVEEFFDALNMWLDEETGEVEN